MINIDPVRWATALSLVASYAMMCWMLARARRPPAQDAGGADWLVAYASQTGTGEALAAHTLATLRTGGLAARVLGMEHVGEAELRAASRVLFIVSTYGEGDAPDTAERFARMLAATDFPLDGLHYGVLALGDSSYAHFCGFGRALDAALQARGAQPLFARVEMDRGSPAAIDTWQHHLSHLAGTMDAPDWSAPAYQQWRLDARELLNPGSAGAPVYLIKLSPAPGASGVLPSWEAGDLVQLSAPADPDYPREYSIASIPSAGKLELMVRLHLREDGSAGAASGWLCREAQVGAAIALRLREHSRFRLGDNAGRPLILIGNGTGMAGLRAHLQQRAQQGEGRNWLVFGERNAAHDYFCRDEIVQWQASGMLEGLSVAFSRDGDELRYVQHLLAKQAGQLRAWVHTGAAIYVCGSLQGMAGGVHAVLSEVLGEAAMAALTDEGRYRRDVY